MAVKKSAGLLLFRLKNENIEFFLVHPGGPFFSKKDIGVWTIPKGEADENEDMFEAAKREFFEETGVKPEGDFIELTPIRQKNGKNVYAWGFEGNIDADKLTSNTFTIEWPPKSGRNVSFPEIDKGTWFDLPTAKEKIIPEQVPLIDELLQKR